MSFKGVVKYSKAGNVALAISHIINNHLNTTNYHMYGRKQFTKQKLINISFLPGCCWVGGAIHYFSFPFNHFFPFYSLLFLLRSIINNNLYLKPSAEINSLYHNSFQIKFMVNIEIRDGGRYDSHCTGPITS